MSFAITAAVVLSVHTSVMGCGWTISSNVFLSIMKSLPVTKNPPVSDSVAEAATNDKFFQFTCIIGPFKISHVNFEGMLPNKKYPATQMRASGSVRYDALVPARKIMSEV